MKIKYLGHACFMLTDEGKSLLIDPYKDGSVNGLRPIHVIANKVICTHEHADHSGVECATILQPAEFEIQEIASWHDNQHGALRGPNTMFVITMGGLKIAHIGDLGCMLDDEQRAKLANLDVLMIPVGGFYTIDGKTARRVAEKLHPRVTLPMHYKTRYNADWPISGPEEFLEGEPEEDIRREIEILRITDRDLSCQPRFALFKA